MHFQWFLCALDESEQERHTQTHGNEEKWGIFSIFPVNQFYKVRFCSVPMLLCIPIYACACGSAVVVRFCWWFFFNSILGIQHVEFFNDTIHLLVLVAFFQFDPFHKTKLKVLIFHFYGGKTHKMVFLFIHHQL